MDTDIGFRTIFPIYVVSTSNGILPISYRGIGFLIADNTLITCWRCVRDTLYERQQYAVLVKSGNDFAAYILSGIKQHTEGFDLAVADVNIRNTNYLKLCETEVTPGEQLVVHGYSSIPGKDALDDTASYFNPRLWQCYVTRLFYYEHPGFTLTYSYELYIPMPRGIYGSPVLRPRSNEVVGVIYGALNIPKTQVSQRLIPGKSDKAQHNNASTITLGLAHHTNNIRSLLGMIALTKPLSESAIGQRDSDREFGGTIAGLESLSVAHAVPKDQMSSKDQSDKYAGDERFTGKPNKTSIFTSMANSFKNGGTGRTMVSGLAKFLDIVTSLLIKFIRKIPFYILQIWKLINKFIEYIRTREERAMAADIEKNLRIVEKYESQLGSESQKRLDKARDVFKDIKHDYPNNQN